MSLSWMMFINSFVKTLLYHKTYPSNVYNALVFNIFRVVPPQSKFRNILNTLKSNPYTPRHFPVSLNPESTSSLPVCVDFLNLDAPAMWSFATDFLGLAQCTYFSYFCHSTRLFSVQICVSLQLGWCSQSRSYSLICSRSCEFILGYRRLCFKTKKHTIKERMLSV